MSYHEANPAHCTAHAGAVELVIEPEERDLGEFSVRRVLPAPERKMVGPFIFFDHMGPAEFEPGHGIQVRPHPHIGLATITYLFEGEILHRDGLGYVQAIRPGAVNQMTAGRGIVHSERAGEDLGERSRLHGIQSWMALPDGSEEIEPAFRHYAAGELPELARDGVTIKVIIGSIFDRTSPVTAYSPMLYLHCELDAGAVLDLPPGRWPELAAYVVTGAIVIDRADYGAGVMAVAGPAGGLMLEAREQSRVMVIGGTPVGERHIWWNFVSSSRQRIEQAKADWREDRYAMVAGDPEYIPLPD
jgi:redox-sensitive bicupin YhaK (pirin superfamily)